MNRSLSSLVGLPRGQVGISQPETLEQVSVDHVSSAPSAMNGQQESLIRLKRRFVKVDGFPLVVRLCNSKFAGELASQMREQSQHTETFFFDLKEELALLIGIGAKEDSHVIESWKRIASLSGDCLSEWHGFPGSFRFLQKFRSHQKWVAAICHLSTNVSSNRISSDRLLDFCLMDEHILKRGIAFQIPCAVECSIRVIEGLCLLRKSDLVPLTKFQKYMGISRKTTSKYARELPLSKRLKKGNTLLVDFEALRNVCLKYNDEHSVPNSIADLLG